jgi:hypothetical protein
MKLLEDTPFLTFEVKVAAPYEIGDIGVGIRRCVPIIGGRVTGSVTGEILSGADWQVIDGDGNLEIDARYAFRTPDGDIVEVSSVGVRSGPPEVLARLAAGEAVDPSAYYFRTAMRFHTAAAKLRHLNFRLAIAHGQRRPGEVLLRVYGVL